MATYVGITDSQTDPDAPLTSDLGKAWTNNVLAMFEGASGAPRILGEAVATEDDGLPIITVSAADTYTVSHGLGIVNGTTSTPDVEVTAITYNVKTFTGSLRFNATVSVAGAAVPQLRLYKNSVQVYEETTVGSYSTDQTLTDGDVFEWRIADTSGTTGSDTSISGISVTGSNAYVPQPVYIQAVNA